MLERFGEVSHVSGEVYNKGVDLKVGFGNKVCIWNDDWVELHLE